MCPSRADGRDSTAWKPEPVPSADVGDLITISMAVGGRDLAFTTCHHCEAKWWYRDGEEVPLASVIGLVVEK